MVGVDPASLAQVAVEESELSFAIDDGATDTGIQLLSQMT